MHKTRPSRKRDSSLSAGAVKARSGAECAGGAARRGLDGAEHSATIEFVMAADRRCETCPLECGYVARIGRYSWPLNGVSPRSARTPFNRSKVTAEGAVMSTRMALPFRP